MLKLFHYWSCLWHDWYGDCGTDRLAVSLLGIDVHLPARWFQAATFALSDYGGGMALKKILLLILAFVGLLGISGCRSRSQKSTDPEQQPLQHAAALERELISAALQGDAKRMEAAVKAGADVNAIDERLGSPLGGASYSGNLEAVRLLTDRGANVNAKDTKGMTPLMNATLGGNADVVRFLIAKGADVNIGSPTVANGRKFTTTALLLARGRRHNEIVTILVEAGAKE